MKVGSEMRAILLNHFIVLKTISAGYMGHNGQVMSGKIIHMSGLPF